MKKYTQHIVMVSIDTLRADCIGASPRANAFNSDHKTTVKLKTDALDTILRSSVYFNNCFSAAPYTAASHGAYFTGMWPLHNGIYEFFNRKLKAQTMFQYAKENGYSTIFQTDFPVILGDALGFTRGVDHYYVEDEVNAFKTLEKNKSHNTFSFFHFGGVHYPYGFHTLKFGGNDYINKVKTLEEKYGISNKEKPIPEDILSETFRTQKDTEFLLRYKYIIEKLYRNANYDDLFELYLEGVNYFIEHRFTEFILKVKKFVDDNDAVLFLFADHGEEWDEYSEGHHNSLSDNVLRVPLMVYGNTVTPRIEEGLIRTIDLAPTIMTLLPQQNAMSLMDGIPLNINKKTEDASYAISQMWTSIATKKRIANYQKKAMASKKYIKPLPTYLSGEVIRTSHDKLARYYKKNGTLLREEKIKKGKNSKKGALKLNEILVNYNSTFSSSNEENIEVESKIRNELNNLGYTI